MARKKRSKFQAPIGPEGAYRRALRRVARVAASIVSSHIDPDEIESVLSNSHKMQAALIAYSESIDGWAKRTANIMLDSVQRYSNRAFRSGFEGVSLSAGELRKNLSEKNVENVIAERQKEQVILIKSIPIEAGDRAQKLAFEAATGGRRPGEIAEELMRTEKVTQARADLIARTEIARSNSLITEARALDVGSAAYIWRSVMDEDTRESHAEMEGEVVRWDSPPTLSDGTVTHAGQIYNCRCFAEPILPDIE